VSGVALVVACAQDTAEGYCEALRLNGLVASLEPGR
jgi:ATP-dependent Clp protease adapter protein ClpS